MVEYTPKFPTTSDPFKGFLDQLKTDGSLYCSSVLRGEWALDLPGMKDKMMFHIITEGESYLQVSNRDPVKLVQGDLALVPHGNGHILSKDPSIEPTPFFESGVEQVSERLESLYISGGEPQTSLMCGVLSFDGTMANFLIQQLPEILVLKKSDIPNEEWVNSSISLIKNEAQKLNPGSEAIITHIADIMVVQIIRHWLANFPEAEEGWFGAMKDKKIGHALRAMHMHPDTRWTVETLGQECGMSRSSFSARFSELVGKSVKTYLVEWRMLTAYQQLKLQNTPLIQLAKSSGYESEAAFSRAFKRVIGVSPSKVHIQQFS